MKQILIKSFIIGFLFVLAISFNPFVYGKTSSNNIISLKKQAALGNINAQLKLGQAYYYGEGVLKDPSMAKFWIRKAYENGSSHAHDIWNNLELWKIPDTPAFTAPVTKKQSSSWSEPVTGMKFIRIKSGCFSMGNGANCSLAHKICVSEFWIGQYEVTQKEYQKIMGTNPSRFYNDNNPVENVSWADAMEFVLRLNKKNNDDYEFNLPSEAQWEYACRNLGKNNVFPWDKNLTKNMANCGNCITTKSTDNTSLPVGSFKPNKSGLFDMGGNLAEWCLDTYEQNAYTNPGKLDNPDPVNKKTGSSRVVRGGSFADNIDKLKCCARKGVIKFIKSDYIGFRLVRKKIE